MPPRRKRGGKVAARRTKSGSKLLSLDLMKNGEISNETNKEDEEKSVKEASNTTFLENTITTRSHKKFGKFRFLIEVRLFNGVTVAWCFNSVFFFRMRSNKLVTPILII